MSAVYPVADSRLFIGLPKTPKLAVTAADFVDVDWAEVDGWANAGQFGDTQNFGEQELIKGARTVRFKTTVMGQMSDNQFVPRFLDPGQTRMRQAAEDRCMAYPIKIEWGGTCAPSGVVTVSVADPAVVTWNGHGLAAGQPVVFSTEGTMPAGLTAGTVYYVLANGLTANSFQIGATATATAGIEVTAAGTGDLILTAPPAGMTDMFYGQIGSGSRQGGGPTSAHLITWQIAQNSNIVVI